MIGSTRRGIRPLHAPMGLARGLCLCLLGPGTLTAAEWLIGPEGTLYPEYLADPRRPQVSAAYMAVADSGLVDAYGVGESRFDLKLGERIRLLRWDGFGEDRFELAIEAGFFGQFDIDHQTDNIGWDGWYGANLSWRVSPHWAIKSAFRHLSSHLGDEFIERTGRLRRGYTREDLTLGIAASSDRLGTAYLEGGVTFNRLRDGQEPGFLQMGWQLARPEAAWGGRWGWQVGVDLQFFEENDWDPGLTLACALLHPAARPDQALRLGVELHTGRYLIGELNELDEDYLSVVFGWDF